MCYGCNSCNKCGKLDRPELEHVRTVRQRCFKCGATLEHGNPVCSECGALVVLPPGQSASRGMSP